MDNLFMNFYQSQGKDFRKLSFNGTLNGSAFSTSITIDQYIPSAQGLCDYLNSTPYFISAGAVAKYVPVPSFLAVLVFYISSVSSDSIRFSGTIDGFGFEKLGFNIPASNLSTSNRYFIGTRHADLSQPPVILVQIDQIPSGISNGYGTMSFVIPNNSSFGSKIIYQNHQKHSCQVIKWDNPVAIQQMTIRLLSCDQLPLETPRQNGTQTNDLDSEVNLVFTINNTMDK